MRQARYNHGCATSTIKEEQEIIVVGGKDENDNEINSFETFNAKENKWTQHSSKLPMALSNLQLVHANSPEYLVYAIGGRDERYNDQATIYGLRTNMEWTLVGNLISKRSSHASVNVLLDHIPGSNIFLLKVFFICLKNLSSTRKVFNKNMLCSSSDW